MFSTLKEIHLDCEYFGSQQLEGEEKGSWCFYFILTKATLVLLHSETEFMAGFRFYSFNILQLPRCSINAPGRQRTLNSGQSCHTSCYSPPRSHYRTPWDSHLHQQLELHSVPANRVIFPLVKCHHLQLVQLCRTLLLNLQLTIIINCWW